MYKTTRKICLDTLKMPDAMVGVMGPWPNKAEAARFLITEAVTDYDRKQSTKRFYNPNALGLYFQAVSSAIEVFREGVSLRQAIVTHFNGRLLDVCLKAVGEKPSTKKEQQDNF